MINVQHLIDNSSSVASAQAFAPLTLGAGSNFRQTQRFVNAKNPLPPGNYGDLVVLHFAASWSRLPFLSLLREDIGDRPLILIEQSYSRSFEHHCVTNRKRFHGLMRLTYQLADMVVAASKNQAAWLIDCELLPPGKVRVIRPLVDWVGLGRFNAPDWPAGRPIRLFGSGSLTRQGGFDVLIEAMRLLPPDFASLTIAGDGEDRAALCQSARNIAGVQFVTGAPAFERNLAIAEAIVVPSRWQPFAIQALEACAAARPLIATNIDGLDEVGNIACGEIVSPDAPSELANAIVRLAARPLRELGLAARAAAFATRDESQAQWSHLLRTVAR